jgi:hypothetical protein
VKILLLIHVLGMACLIGMIVPVRAIRAQFAESTSGFAKAALALTAIRMRMVTAVIFVIVVFSGIGMTHVGGYPWFNFSTVFWLAFKQLFGLLLLGDTIATLAKSRKFRKALLAASGNESALNELLRNFPKMISRAQIGIGVGWVLATLGVLKIAF